MSDTKPRDSSPPQPSSTAPRTGAGGEASPADEIENEVEEIVARVLEAEEGERRARFESELHRRPDLSEPLRARARLLHAFGLTFDDLEPATPASIGDFELLRRIGQGGMGVVYEARQRSLGRTVALKLIRPDQLFFEGARERFRREAQAIARLAHPGIVPVHLVGEENGLPYFAMELVSGCTLAEALSALAGRAVEDLRGVDLADIVERAARDRGASAVPTSNLRELGWIAACIELVAQVASALDHAHAHGIVHRDVKPSNIVLGADGRARLVDFGLISRTDAQPLTRSGSQVGTILYMPPEQARDRARPDARADVYSLGVVLYELLTLRRPYDGDDVLAILRAAAQGRPTPLRTLNRRAPADLETVCAVAMDPDPARRYASAGDFARDLSNVATRRPIEARPPPAWVRGQRLVQRHPSRSAAALLALSLIGGVPLALYLQQRGHSAELQHSLEQVREANRIADGALAEQRESTADMERSLGLVTNIFARAAPSVAKGADYDLRDLLELGADDLAADAGARPLARARIQMAIGSSLLELGASARALELFESAQHSYSEGGSRAPHSGIGAALRSQGDAHSVRGERSRALECYSAAIDALDDEHRSCAHERGLAFAGRGWELMNAGRLAEADEDLLAARRLALSVEGPTSASVAHLDARRAALEFQASRFDDAACTLDPALRAMAGRPEEAGVRLVEGWNLRGLISRRLGDSAAALDAYGRALEYARHFYKREGARHAELYLNLASAESACGEPELELAMLARALVLFEAELGRDHPKTVLCAGNLAGARTRARQFAAAESTYADVIARQIQAYGADHAFVGHSLRNLAACARARNDAKASSDLEYEAASVLLKSPGQVGAAIDAFVFSGWQAMVGDDLGRAESILREAFAEAQARLPQVPLPLLRALADVCGKQGRRDEERQFLSLAAGR